MFRKFFAAAMALMLVVGGLFAEEVKGVFKKLDGDKVVVEVDGKEKAYAVSSEAKTKIRDKEVPLSEAVKRWKEGVKLELTIEKDKITAGKMTRK